VRTRSTVAPDRELSRPVRLGPADLITIGLVGLRTRKLRAALSALGIAIGIATMIIVTSIPASSERAVVDQITALGTNVLQAWPAPSDDKPTSMPRESVAMVARIGPVQVVSAVANTHTVIRRSELVDGTDDSGLAVLATDLNLLGAVNAEVAQGTFLNATTERLPTVVLGSVAAARLGVSDTRVDGRPVGVVIGGQSFTVVGVLRTTPLSPALDRAALVGWDSATELLDFDGRPTMLYLRCDETAIDAVRAVLPATVDPDSPGSIRVSRPGDALKAKKLTQNAFSSLFLALAGVSLLVGGVGVANTMVISVLERRREIGLRRALGATRGQIRGQFLIESVALAMLGGAAGVLAGLLVTFGYTTHQGWTAVIPVTAVAGGLLGAVAVGAAAGLYPAIRASLITPNEALSGV
jgi:putative ABC transport system permease protein